MKIILLKNCKLKRLCCGYILWPSVNVLFIKHIVARRFAGISACNSSACFYGFGLKLHINIYKGAFEVLCLLIVLVFLLPEVSACMLRRMSCYHRPYYRLSYEFFEYPPAMVARIKFWWCCICCITAHYSAPRKFCGPEILPILPAIPRW